VAVWAEWKLCEAWELLMRLVLGEGGDEEGADGELQIANDELRAEETDVLGEGRAGDVGCAAVGKVGSGDAGCGAAGGAETGGV